MEEVSPVAGDTPPAVVRSCAKASAVVNAVTDLLRAVAGLLRQLVHIAGWCALLMGIISLLLNPHVSLEHLAAPGVGVLAILQNLIIRSQRKEETMLVLDEGLLPVEAETESETALLD